jgi:bleomycin hydrolase
MLKPYLTLICIALALAAPLSVAAQEKGAIDSTLLARFEKRAVDDPNLPRLVNAATNNDIRDLSLNRELVRTHDSHFNLEVKATGIIDQKSSGRCWMFAGANTITPKVMNKLKLSNFSLSEAYLAFWDKLEKSNFFLETMIQMRDRKIDDRSLQMYLEEPMGDGGWWNYFETLIRKYGVIPASAMPETKQSSSTNRLNGLLNTLLRKATAEIRRMHQAGKKEADLRKYKEDVLADVYKMLVYAYGQPPKEFVFRYEEEQESTDTTAKSDKGADTAEVKAPGADSTKAKTKRLVDRNYTPQSFFKEFYGDMTTEYVALVHNPTMKDATLYEMMGSRNMFEKPDIRFLNMPMAKLKEYAYKMILDSQLVWFVCDVGRDNYRDSGMFAVDIYDYSTTLGIDLSTTKSDRISYRDTSPNHVMVFLAVDTTEAGVPRKWRVENSWGSSMGSGGYWTMYDTWFDENVLLVLVDKKLLSEADVVLLDQKPVVMEDWQPFFRALTRLQ